MASRKKVLLKVHRTSIHGWVEVRRLTLPIGHYPR
jgi:hypothetical protein